MENVVLTYNEREVLVAIVNNAQSVGDTGIEYILADVADALNRSIHSVTGTAASLRKKGLISCFNGGTYFDGYAHDTGLEMAEDINKDKSYNSLKEKHSDTMLLLRVCGCYQAYHEDADNLSKVTGYDVEPNSILGKVSEFKANQLDIILPKIVRAGYRVAICDKL